MNSRYKKIFLISGMLILFLVIGYSIYVYSYISQIEVNWDKDYNTIYISEHDIADYSIFIDVPEQYRALEQLDYELRKSIADYMKINNLKLISGQQKFKRIHPTFDELVYHDFKMEPIAK